MALERQRAVLRMLGKLGVQDASNLTVVEVGSGSGQNLQDLIRFGFSPANLTGIDLLESRITEARNKLPTGVRLIHGDASTVPIRVGSIDIVYQSVVFSSLLDDAYQQQLADAMWRWLKPGGGILWYDFVWNNPQNPDVRGVHLRRIGQLFADGRITHRRITLAPPIARGVAAIHPQLYTLFNAIPLLRTHLLCWIEKPA